MKYVVRENTAMHAICDAKFTSRRSVYCAPFKGFRIHSYGVQHGNFVRRRFKLHRYYISDAPDACNIRRSLLTSTKQRVASIDYRTSRS